MASFEAACVIHGSRDKVLDQVESQYGAGFNRNYEAWTEGPQLRAALGKAAKASGWFKRQSWAQEWINAIHTIKARSLMTPSESI